MSNFSFLPLFNFYFYVLDVADYVNAVQQRRTCGFLKVIDKGEAEECFLFQYRVRMSFYTTVQQF